MGRLGLVAACGVLGAGALLLYLIEPGRKGGPRPAGSPEREATRPPAAVEFVAPARRESTDGPPLSLREALAGAGARPARTEQVETESVAEARVDVALHGMVVDLDGRAVEGATVKLFSLGKPDRVDCGDSTDASGEFALDQLEVGPHRLLVQGRFVSSAPLDLALVEGENEAGRVLLPAAPAAGALRGRLLCDDGGEDPFAALLLRELESGKQLAVPSDWMLFSEDDGITSFEIPGLPDGQYELAVVPVDGREYEPPFLRVSPPADGLEFRARAGPRRVNRLRVRDAASGAELQGFVMLGRIRGQWTPGDLGAKGELPASFDRWVVYTKGHRPARGDYAGAPEVGRSGDGAEVHEVEVALEPGHGLAVLFRDVASDRLLAPAFEDLFGAGLEGVTVLADGEPLARSDEEGLAVLDLPREGAQLSFERPGWRVVGEREVEGALLVHLSPDPR